MVQKAVRKVESRGMRAKRLRFERGICSRCINPRMPNSRFCDPCGKFVAAGHLAWDQRNRAHRNKYRREVQAIKKLNGECSNCTKRAVPGKRRCKRHQKYMREYARKRKERRL